MGLPRAKVMSVLGSVEGEKAISMIAIHAHGIPHIFPAEVLAEAEAAKPGPLERPRGLARHPADHHRSG
jgi:ribonuclease R